MWVVATFEMSAAHFVLHTSWLAKPTMLTYQDQSLAARRRTGRTYDEAYDSVVAILSGAQLQDPRQTRFLSTGLTASLLLVIVIYSFAAVINMVALLDAHGADKIQAVYPGLPAWIIPVTTVLASAKVVSAIAILFRRKRGYYAFVVTALAMACVQFSAAGGVDATAITRLSQCLITLFWPLLFFVLLHANGPRSAWYYFE